MPREEVVKEIIGSNRVFSYSCVMLINRNTNTRLVNYLSQDSNNGYHRCLITISEKIYYSHSRVNTSHAAIAESCFMQGLLKLDKILSSNL